MLYFIYNISHIFIIFYYIYIKKPRLIKVTISIATSAMNPYLHISYLEKIFVVNLCVSKLHVENLLLYKYIYNFIYICIYVYIHIDNYI